MIHHCVCWCSRLVDVFVMPAERDWLEWMRQKGWQRGGRMTEQSPSSPSSRWRQEEASRLHKSSHTHICAHTDLVFVIWRSINGINSARYWEMARIRIYRWRGWFMRVNAQKASTKTLISNSCIHVNESIFFSNPWEKRGAFFSARHAFCPSHVNYWFFFHDLQISNIHRFWLFPWTEPTILVSLVFCCREEARPWKMALKFMRRVLDPKISYAISRF